MLLQFSTEPVENFVGKAVGPRRKPRPVSLPASLHAFAAAHEPQQNQQLSAVEAERDDAAQQMQRRS